MAQSFIPADVRRKQALARTTAPGGGYRYAQQSAVPPQKASSIERAKASSGALGSRLGQEQALGLKRGMKTVNPSAAPGESQPKRSYASRPPELEARPKRQLFSLNPTGSVTASAASPRPHLTIFKGTKV